MTKLFKHIIPYWKVAIVLVFLLLAQAYCDMALPQYTQDIIDTGIQNHGIEHVLPEKIKADDFATAQFFMSDEEREAWQGAYKEDGDIFVLSVTDDEELDALDAKLTAPLVIAYRAGQAGGYTSVQEAFEQADLDSGMSQQDMEKMMASVGDQTLHSIGVQYAAEKAGAAGVDINATQTSYLWRKGSQMLLMTLLMVAIAMVVSFIAARVGAGIGKNLRNRMFSKVMSFSSAEMDNFETSSLITRATNDIQQVQMTSTMMLRMLLYAPVMCVWGIVKVYNTHANMSWTIVLGVFVIVSIVGILMSISVPKFKKMQMLIDGVNSVSREMLTGLPVIRAFCREETEEKRFDRANTRLMKTQLFTNRVMAFMQPSMMIAMNGLVVLITWVAAHRIDDGNLQVGAMTAFITYSMMIVSSFMMITIMSIMLPRAGVAAERIDEVMSTEPSIKEKEGAEDITDVKGEVRFSHVDFRYDEAEDNALTDIDFVVKPGETLAIIGGTGSGKTTLVNLIMRFFDVTSGSVMIDGKDVRDLSLKSLRESIGFVPQKGILFSGTIGSNIRFGKLDASDEEVAEAAATAQALEFINEKEDKFDSYISQGGSNVSGGQKQRLAIARALAKKPKILVFDDSFSALDLKTDSALRKELARKAAGVTQIVVAQRVGTILNADQIIVLEDGEVVGKGKHDELMETCEIYRQIAESQLSQSGKEAS